MSYIQTGPLYWLRRQYCADALEQCPTTTVRSGAGSPDHCCSFPDYRINQAKLQARLASIFGMSKGELQCTWQQGEYFVYNVPSTNLTEVSKLERER